MEKRWLAGLLAAGMLLGGCSRDGFEASLDRSRPASSAPTAVAPLPPIVNEPPQSQLPMDVAFEITEGSYQEGGAAFTYALPESAQNPDMATRISEQIETLLRELPAEFKMSKPHASLTLTDEVMRNDGIVFSSYYQVVFNSDQELWPDKFAFGLSFNAKTGTQLTLDALTPPNTLAALLLDETASNMLTEDEAMAKAQRKAMADMGLAALAEKVVANAPQSSAKQLLAFSYYLEGTELVAMMPVAHTSGDFTRLSVLNNGI